MSKTPSGRAPKKLYWVDVETIGKLRYRQSGGGKFTHRQAAEDRQRYLVSQGIDATLYEGEIIWTPVTEETE